MTPEEVEISLAFDQVEFQMASWAKRFARDMNSVARQNPKFDLTPEQSEWIFRLLYRYRKQLPALYNKYQYHPLCNYKAKET